MTGSEEGPDTDTWSTKERALFTTQPGLEVVPQEHLPNNDHLAQARPPETAKYTVVETVASCDAKFQTDKTSTAGDVSPELVSSDFPEVADARHIEATSQIKQAKRRKRRILVVVGSVVLVFITVGAVLGGVLGSRATRNSTSQDDMANTTSTGTAVPDLGYAAMVDTSQLSVTGRRRKDGSSEWWLFYEDWDDRPQRLHWDTNRGGALKAPANLTIKLPHSPENEAIGGLISATTIVHGEEYNPEVNVFVTTHWQNPDDGMWDGTNTQILGIDFDSTDKPTNRTQIAEKGLRGTGALPITSTGASIVSYWPWLVYGYTKVFGQDGSESSSRFTIHLIEACNQLDKNSYAPTPDWTIRNLTIEAKLGTKMSLIPLSADFKNSSRPFDLQSPTQGYALFYQGPDDRLKVLRQGTDSLAAPGYPPELPDVKLPTDEQLGRGAMSAFAVPRRGGGQNSKGRHPDSQVNIGVMSIDRNRRIQFHYWDPDHFVGWVSMGMETLNTLAPPDLYTSIACLNMASSALDEDGEGEMLMPLEQDPDGTLVTCFYQSNKQVVRARWDGTRSDFETGWAVDRMPIPIRSG
ncbi:hypothetical protein QBC40DRAFT_325304 [Triangularia verruculosa]|uniref:Uncharacterized protein n=1 Tax=Triangularia verruculosa TaxID=2587418 RepID=A0AAN6XIP6_9PEZI|nr:hypothetical protein QBC40DRAFT_325304 [Triangularia verruculosa]